MDGDLPLFGHNRLGYTVQGGWEGIGDLSFEEWTELGLELGRAERETPWKIGDWWNSGERYGQRVDVVKAPEWDGPTYGSCRVFGSVANTFNPLSRLNSLSFLHHQEAASLANEDRAAADRLLQAAAENNQSAADLAKAIRLHRAKQKVASLPHAPPGSTPDNPWGNVQHFDIWQFQNADDDSEYFGKLPRQVAENLLWHFTAPGQMIVDPFAGGGILLDVAEAMDRRIWASDLSPSRPTIHQHDITAGWPANAPQADLIFLDPPYWQQARGRYSQHAADLGNLSIDDFDEVIDRIIAVCCQRLNPGGRLAYIISPTQCEDGTVIDHATDMLAACANAGLRIERRIIVPYQTQQATGQQVTWARENKRMLKLYRDLVVLAP